jgi:hypothetical protein
MINSTSHQAWLFYSPLARQAALLKDDLLDPVAECSAAVCSASPPSVRTEPWKWCSTARCKTSPVGNQSRR